jgi:predicted DNA repair protein MutK
VAGIGGVLAWFVNTAISAVVGLAVGAAVAVIVTRVRRRSGHTAAAH